MGLIEFINKLKLSKEDMNYSKMLNGYTPVFSQFGKNIYASDVVQQAISCIVTETKKLSPIHIREDENEPIPVESNIQKILERPNVLMTQSDFLEKIIWQLYLNYNSFILPTYSITKGKDGTEKKKYTGLYPIQPTNITFLQDPTDNYFIEFTFANGYKPIIRYEDVIHIRYRYSVNEFLGGNEFGQPDNDAVLKTLELNDVLLQGVGKALKSSFSINGVVKYNTLMDGDKMDKAIAKLEQHLKNNESGFLPLDMKGEFIPLSNKIQLVDEKTLKFIDEKILRHYGVSLPILTGDYTKSQYEAFYQKTLEPLVISIGQAFTKALFTETEKDHKNSIKFYPHELIFMDTSQKLEMVRLLGDSGAMFENEKRVAFGLKPDASLKGVRMMSKNYGTVESVRNMDKVGGDDNA